MLQILFVRTKQDKLTFGGTRERHFHIVCAVALAVRQRPITYRFYVKYARGRRRSNHNNPELSAFYLDANMCYGGGSHAAHEGCLAWNSFNTSHTYKSVLCSIALRCHSNTHITWSGFCRVCVRLCALVNCLIVSCVQCLLE